MLFTQLSLAHALPKKLLLAVNDIFRSVDQIRLDELAVKCAEYMRIQWDTQSQKNVEAIVLEMFRSHDGVLKKMQGDTTCYWRHALQLYASCHFTHVFFNPSDESSEDEG